MSQTTETSPNSSGCPTSRNQVDVDFVEQLGTYEDCHIAFGEGDNRLAIDFCFKSALDAHEGQRLIDVAVDDVDRLSDESPWICC